MSTPREPVTVEITENNLETVVIDQSQGIDINLTAAGPQGPRGEQGIQGVQGIEGIQGETGPSAYEEAVGNGFTGTEAEWLASLKGEKGDQGIQGIQGSQGIGVPVGGSTDQVLKKNTTTDNDTSWASAKSLVLPAGGTLNQILNKKSASDYDIGWTDAPTKIPAGGNAGQILSKKTVVDYDLSWVNMIGKFRGEWTDATLFATYSFSDGTIPAPFAATKAGTSSFLPAVVAQSVDVYTKAVQFKIGNGQVSNQSKLSLRLLDLGVSNIVKVKAWSRNDNGQNAGSMITRFVKNGGTVISRTGGYGWTQDTVACTESDTIDWLTIGTGTNITVNALSWVTGIQVFTSLDPYMLGQFVTYDGKLWKSNTDSNTSVPGADGNWVAVPVNGLSTNTQVGTAYTLTSSDSNQRVTLANASASTLTIPANASVAISVGSSIDVINLGAGKVTISPSAGVTLNKDSTLAGFSLTQYQRGTLTKTATDTWVFSLVGPQLLGDTAWLALTYQNSWVDVGGAYATGGYRKDYAGTAHLKGRVSGGATGTVIATLPAGYRPAATRTFSVSTDVAGMGTVEVANTGEITIVGASTLTYVALDAIRFLAEA